MHMLLAPVAAKQVNHGGREEARTSLYSVAVTSLRILNTVRQQGSDIGLEKNQVINIPDTISCRQTDKRRVKISEIARKVSHMEAV